MGLISTSPTHGVLRLSQHLRPVRKYDKFQYEIFGENIAAQQQFAVYRVREEKSRRPATKTALLNFLDKF